MVLPGAPQHLKIELFRTFAKYEQPLVKAQKSYKPDAAGSYFIICYCYKILNVI